MARIASPDAMIVTLDVAIDDIRRAGIARFATHRQQIVALKGDSHDPRVRDRVHAVLAGRALDVLFIDGDHSYAGVRSDFEMFSPLVGASGVIVLHDIVPDAASRGLPATDTFTGGVPQFWRELAAQSSDWREIIEDPNQDGYGIGALVWPGGRS